MSLSFWEVSLSCPCSFPQDPKSLIEPWPEACGQTICCRLSHVLSLWGLQKSPHLALCPQQTHVDLCLLWSFLPMQTVCMSQRTFSAATSSATGMLSLLLGLSWACFPIALSASWSPGTPASLIHAADQPCPAHSWDATQTFLILGLSQPKTHLLNQPFFFLSWSHSDQDWKCAPIVSGYCFQLHMFLPATMQSVHFMLVCKSCSHQTIDSHYLNWNHLLSHLPCTAGSCRLTQLRPCGAVHKASMN